MRKTFSLMLLTMLSLSIMGCGNYDYDIVIDHANDLSGKYFVHTKSMWHTEDGDSKISPDSFIEVKKNGMGISVKLFEKEDSKEVESVDFTYNELAGAVEKYKVEGISMSRYTLNKGTVNVIFTIGKNNVYEAKPTIDYESEKASFHGMRDYKETYEYVEIGGVKWATMNVGATTVAGSPETCYGDYFAWGEIEPYYGTKEWDSTKSKWLFNNWKSGKDGGYCLQSYCGDDSFTEWSTPPYDDTNKILTSGCDAATMAWGLPWRTPTKADFQALMKACTGTKDNTTPTPLNSSSPKGGVYWLESDQDYLEEYKGVVGILFVDKIDTSKRVFFPASGFVRNTSLANGGSNGRYLSSSLITNNNSTTANSLLFLTSNVIPSRPFDRYLGGSVRPVSD